LVSFMVFLVSQTAGAVVADRSAPVVNDR